MSCSMPCTTPFQNCMLSPTSLTLPNQFSSSEHSKFGRRRGRSKGTPLGPYSSAYHCSPSYVRLRYLDDILLEGNLEHVRHDLSTIADLELSTGLRLNRQKCEYLSDVELTHADFACFQRIDRDTLTLLGAPLFRGKALDVALQDHS